MWTYKEDDTPGVLTAREHIAGAHRGQGGLKLPETAVLFYMGKAVEYLTAARECTLLTEKLPRFLYGCPVWGLSEGVCLLDGGRGAPQAADTLETLAVLGVKRVFTVGMCGAFSRKVEVGEVIVPNRAFVEEGVSLHYYEQIESACPDKALFDRLRAMPGAKVFPIVTTDAVYRQTFFKERLWREKGAVGVDMETSALFSVGRYLGLQVASALMVSDRHPESPDAPRWQWHMTDEMRRSLVDRAPETVFADGEAQR